MTDQTRRATRVRVPGQAGPSTTSTATTNTATATTAEYQPRHRAVPSPAEALPEPTVVPPSGQLASQRRAAAARARGTGNPALRGSEPLLPHQVQRIYDTPGWVPETTLHTYDEPHLEPVGDAVQALAPPEGMIRQARWTSPQRASAAAVLLLLGFLAAAASTGSGLLSRQSTPTLALSLACLLGAAGVYALLVVLRPVVVELAEPWLTVRRGGRQDRFNLASPFVRLQVSGRPGSRRWLLLLDSPDGRVVRVPSRMVDSRRLDVVVGYGQAVAARERAARDERFNR